MFVGKRTKEYIVDESQVLRMLDLLNFYICVYISYYISGNVFAGAVFFMGGFSAGSFFRLSMHKGYFIQHKPLFLLLIFMAVCMPITGILIVTLAENVSNLFVLIASAVIFTARTELTHHVILYKQNARAKCLLYMVVAQLLSAAALCVLLGSTVNWGFSWEMTALSLIYSVFVLLWICRAKSGELVERANYAAGHIASYRLYSALLLCSNSALYLSIMTYTGMLMFMPAQSSFVLPAILWIALVVIITVVLGRLINRKMLKRMEKTTLFVLGGTIWLLAHIRLNESFAAFNSSMAWRWSILQAAGLAIMMLLTTYMQEDMRLVLELTEDGDETAVKTYRVFAQQIAFIFSGVLICVELFFMNSVVGSNLIGWDIYAMRGQFMRLLNTLPLGFVLLSMLFAVLQPLSRDVVQKLKLYSSQKASRSIEPAFEFKLNRLLIKRYRKRIGIRILALVLRPWLHHKILGAKQVQTEDEPVIFVANHRQIYGPVAAYLNLPFVFRPWIEHKMLDREEIMRYIWANPFSKIKPSWLARILWRVAGPILIWALNSVEPIPVYRRDSARDVLKTINMTVSVLQEKDNILIFPEDPAKSPDGHYASSGISPFFTGFVSVAKQYYKKTGKAIKFYPIYLNSEKRTITFGGGVAYNPEGTNEADRVCGLLMSAMRNMAESV